MHVNSPQPLRASAETRQEAAEAIEEEISPTAAAVE